MKVETLVNKLGIEDTVNSIVENCECGEVNGIRIERISQMRVQDLQEEIGNFLDADLYSDKFLLQGRYMSTFCKEYDINPKLLSSYYAASICEGGCEIAYAINEDIVLVIE